MQFKLAIAACLAASASASPILDLLVPILSGSSVSCSSGTVYCTDGSKDTCKKTEPGQTCTSGSVVCCDSSANLLNLQLLPICGNSIPISVPVTVNL